MDYNTLQDLYFHEIKDLYSAEKQILRALPKVLRHATNETLREGIEKHFEETKGHVERLNEIFERHGKSPRGAKCRGIEGIIEEGEDWLDEEATPDVMDAGIISALQRVEHYEIAGYGTARAFAEILGQEEDLELLDATLQEEGAADKTLTEASEMVNAQAQEQSAQ